MTKKKKKRFTAAWGWTKGHSGPIHTIKNAVLSSAGGTDGSGNRAKDENECDRHSVRAAPEVVK